MTDLMTLPLTLPAYTPAILRSAGPAEASGHDESAFQSYLRLSDARQRQLRTRREDGVNLQAAPAAVAGQTTPPAPVQGSQADAAQNGDSTDDSSSATAPNATQSALEGSLFPLTAATGKAGAAAMAAAVPSDRPTAPSDRPTAPSDQATAATAGVGGSQDDPGAPAGSGQDAATVPMLPLPAEANVPSASQQGATTATPAQVTQPTATVAVVAVHIQPAPTGNGARARQSAAGWAAASPAQAAGTTAAPAMAGAGTTTAGTRRGNAPHQQDSAAATTVRGTTPAAVATATFQAPTVNPAITRDAKPSIVQIAAGPAAWVPAVDTSQATGATAGAVSAHTLDQVADGLVMSIRSGKTEATITLRPAALGEVRAQITSGPDGLVIRLSAERDSVGEMLRTRVGELRSILAGQQIAVAELHVLHNPPPAASSGSQDGATWQQNRRAPKEQDATAGDGRQPAQDEEMPEE